MGQPMKMGDYDRVMSSSVWTAQRWWASLTSWWSSWCSKLPNRAMLTLPSDASLQDTEVRKEMLIFICEFIRDEALSLAQLRLRVSNRFRPKGLNWTYFWPRCIRHGDQGGLEMAQREKGYEPKLPSQSEPRNQLGKKKKKTCKKT